MKTTLRGSKAESSETSLQAPLRGSAAQSLAATNRIQVSLGKVILRIIMLRIVMLRIMALLKPVLAILKLCSCH
jgi:hypothetical protein